MVEWLIDSRMGLETDLIIYATICSSVRTHSSCISIDVMLDLKSDIEEPNGGVAVMVEVTDGYLRVP